MTKQAVAWGLHFVVVMINWGPSYLNKNSPSKFDCVWTCHAHFCKKPENWDFRVVVWVRGLGLPCLAICFTDLGGSLPDEHNLCKNKMLCIKFLHKMLLLYKYGWNIRDILFRGLNIVIQIGYLELFFIDLSIYTCKSEGSFSLVTDFTGFSTANEH